MKKQSKKPSGFNLQLKPVGSFCNLKCKYCYVEPFKEGRRFQVMGDNILERTISNFLKNTSVPIITWHGGEPTLAGLEFFQRAIEFMNSYRQPGQTVRNVLQTNATLITPQFAGFLKETEFEVSVSLDGPQNVHGIHRVNYAGKNSFPDVIRGIENLRQAGLDPSVIATVTQETLPFAVEVFDFLVQNGFRRIKYSPVYDSASDQFSISSEKWYTYLLTVFNRWFELGNPDISVRELDEVIAWLDKETVALCSSENSCFNWVSVDPNGQLYPCEYLRSFYGYGNIETISLQDIPETENYQRFLKIVKAPPEKCKQCEFYSLCGNGCPATRVENGLLTPSGVYVYCEQRQKLFGVVKQAFEA